MSRTKKITADEKNLIKRYLIWCYKTTKEEIDKIDRKFTQIVVDDVLLKELNRVKAPTDKKVKDQYVLKVEEFRKYKEAKEKTAQAQRYFDPTKKTFRPDYLYLKNRLRAIEKAVCHFFSAAELKNIKALYEEEMTSRILTAREHP